MDRKDEPKKLLDAELEQVSGGVGDDPLSLGTKPPAPDLTTVLGQSDGETGTGTYWVEVRTDKLAGSGSGGEEKQRGTY